MVDFVCKIKSEGNRDTGTLKPKMRRHSGHSLGVNS